jgi:hypothetical protein
MNPFTCVGVSNQYLLSAGCNGMGSDQGRIRHSLVRRRPGRTTSGRVSPPAESKNSSIKGMNLPRCPWEILSGGVQCTIEGVVGVDLRVASVAEEKAAVSASHDLPPGPGVVRAGNAGAEHVGAMDGCGEVRVGAAAEGHKAEAIGAAGVEEEAEERGRVHRAEAAGEERTARKARQPRAARTRDGSEGRRRKISRRRSSVRASIVVDSRGGWGFSGDGGGDGDWEAMEAAGENERRKLFLLTPVICWTGLNLMRPGVE